MNKLFLIVFLFLNLTAFAQIDTTEQVYVVVEEMPTLKSCAAITDYLKRKSCSDKQLLEYLYKNFKTPNIDKNLILSCDIKNVISFIVEKDSSISNLKIIRSCEEFEETLKTLFNNLPEFEAGKQNGIPVRVKMQFPMRICFR